MPPPLRGKIQMKKRTLLFLSAFIGFMMLSVFGAIYQKTGKLPAKIVGLVTFTCLPPMGMLLVMNRKGRR